MDWLWVCGGGRKEDDDVKVRDGARVREYQIELEADTYWEYVTTAGFNIDTIKKSVRRPGGFPRVHRRRLWELVVDKSRKSLLDEKSGSEANVKWDDSAFETAYRVVYDVDVGLLKLFRKYCLLNNTQGSQVAEEYLGSALSLLESTTLSTMSERHKIAVRNGVEQIRKDLIRGTQQIDNDRLVGLLLTFVVYNNNSKYKNEIYVQGTDMIAMTLIDILDDKHAFWAFTFICEVSMENYFTDQLRGARVEMSVFIELVREKLPKFTAFLEKLDDYDPVNTYISSWTFPWFVQIFAGRLPPTTALHIFDVYFTLLFSRIGARVMLHAVGLSIFTMIEREFLQSEDQDAMARTILAFTGGTDHCREEYGKLSSPEVSARFMAVVFEYLDELSEGDLRKKREVADLQLQEEDIALKLRRAAMKKSSGGRSVKNCT